MAKNEDGFVSVVGAALIQPILDLVEKLESMKPVLPNEVKTRAARKWLLFSNHRAQRDPI